MAEIQKRQVAETNASIAARPDRLAEYRIIIELFNNPETLNNPNVSEDLFNFTITKNIYKSIANIYDKKLKPSVENVTQELMNIDFDANEKVLPEILSTGIKPTGDISDAIEQLKDFTKRQEVIANLNAAILNIKNGAKLSPETIELVRSKIDAADLKLTEQAYDNKRVYTLEEFGDSYLEQTKAREFGRVYKFGHGIDLILNDGPAPGDFGVLSGQTGTGKSLVALDIVDSLINQDIPTMYFSIEMSGVSTFDRIVARRKTIPYANIVHPEIDEWLAIRTAQEETVKELKGHKNFRFCEAATVSLADIRRHIKKFQADIGQLYCIVIIDLLSQVTDFVKQTHGQNQAFSIEKAVNDFSAICKECQVHGLGIIQLNRGSMANKPSSIDAIKKMRPTVYELKNAGAWGERARYVLGAFRLRHFAKQLLNMTDDELNAEDDTKTDILELSCLKQNNGNLGRVNFIFDGEYFQLAPLLETNSLDEPGDKNANQE
jgi:replicative DNA helicase